MNTRRLHGIVHQWSGERGFGFLRSENNDKRIFAHFRDVQPQEQLTVGERVTFEIGESPDGRPRAVNVRRA